MAELFESENPVNHALMGFASDDSFLPGTGEARQYRGEAIEFDLRTLHYTPMKVKGDNSRGFGFTPERSEIVYDNGIDLNPG